MSVEEIQARIDQFSADIDQQKLKLRQLERDKSSAQRELNAICDPIMARLPSEISSHIFLHCLPETPVPNAGVAPILLLHVCSAWRNIALFTPALWATISINSSTPADSQIWGPWLRRACDYPLSISFAHGFGHVDAKVFGPYFKQIRRLEISDKDFRVDLIQCELSSLQTLTIRAVQRWQGYQAAPEDFYTLQVVKLLGLAPNLVECTLVDVTTGNHLNHGPLYPHDSSSRRASPHVTLPRLHRLELVETSTLRGHVGGTGILKHLTLPTLEALILPLDKNSASMLSLFLNRSSPPPLQTLELSRGRGNNSLTLAELDQSLRLIPSLAHLKCYAWEESFLDDLFSALADAPSLFLPNLQSLQIQHPFSGLSERSYKRVYRALSLRREQLVCVVIKGGGVTGFRRSVDIGMSGPDADAGHDLRRPVMEGMDIYIGD
ncbi:hypothetical protein B0H19DRAFT_568695 [Mycena capillaripes]|nr:hypothetical protein B0H19DRAFT_568695 [Mycena capillaripes]